MRERREKIIYIERKRYREKEREKIICGERESEEKIDREKMRKTEKKR